MNIRYLVLIEFFIAVAMYFATGSGDYDDNLISIVLLLALIGFWCFFYLQQHSELKNNWVKPSTFFLLSFIIVSFQSPLDLILGYKNINIPDLFSYPLYINKTVVLCLVGMLSFLLGYISTKSKNRPKNKTSYRILKTDILVGLQLLFFVLWLMNIDIILFLTGKYYSDTTASESYFMNLFEGMFGSANIALFVAVCYNNQLVNKNSIAAFIKSIPVMSWAVLTLYILLRMLSGDRGPFIYTILLIFYAYVFFSRKKISFKFLVLAVFSGALLLTVIGIARSSVAGDFGQALDQFGKEGRFGYKSVSPVTEELSMSNNCNLVAVNDISEGITSYHMGGYQLSSIINVIPFAPSFMQNTLGIPQTSLASDAYLTISLKGDNSISQMGTTPIADFYLDLGLIGVILGMLFTGVLFKKIDGVMLQQGLIGIVMITIFLLYASKCIYFPRHHILAGLKDIFPVLVFIYLQSSLTRGRYIRFNS